MPSYHNQPVQALAQQTLEDVHILLVEDELDIAELLLLLLQSAGATVRLCEEAESVLAILESVQPDILVCNIRLPLHDGIWLIEQIRNHPRPEIRQIPALGVSSYLREVSAREALAAGFDCFLSKLDSPSAIVDTISTLVTHNNPEG
jgi:CheY-like chemotaxis protein